jgi:hypothetical protein
MERRSTHPFGKCASLAGRRAFRRSIAAFSAGSERSSRLPVRVHRRRAAHFGNVGCSLLLIPRGRATVSAPFQGRASATAKDRTFPSASSWQGAVVPPGGAPTPPECELCVSSPAGSASTKARNCRAPAAGVPGAHLRSRPPARPTQAMPRVDAPRRAG